MAITHSTGGDDERLRAVAGTWLGVALAGPGLAGMQPGRCPLGQCGGVEDGTLVVLEDS